MDIESYLVTMLSAVFVLALTQMGRRLINKHFGIRSRIEFESNFHSLLEEEVANMTTHHSNAPTNCVNCGAALNSKTCEYCGTVYD